jgi:hypothetical protein
VDKGYTNPIIKFGIRIPRNEIDSSSTRNRLRKQRISITSGIKYLRTFSL